VKPVLYIFMLPFVTKNNKYIIKIGYKTYLIKRHNELKLIYCYVIDGEHTELNIHKNLEKTFFSSVYKMIKMKILKNTYNIEIT
jgi:hypothetical protein